MEHTSVPSIHRWSRLRQGHRRAPAGGPGGAMVAGRCRPTPGCRPAAAGTRLRPDCGPPVVARTQHDRLCAGLVEEQDFVARDQRRDAVDGEDRGDVLGDGIDEVGATVYAQGTDDVAWRCRRRGCLFHGRVRTRGCRLIGRCTRGESGQDQSECGGPIRVRAAVPVFRLDEGVVHRRSPYRRACIGVNAS